MADEITRTFDANVIKEKSKDYRIVVVSTIAISADDNLVQITLGLEMPVTDTEHKTILEEVRLVITPRTLAVFHNVMGGCLTSLANTMAQAQKQASESKQEILQ